MQFFEDLHDVTLVTRARIGDLSALEVLIQRYRRVLYTVALGMLGDPIGAREATRTALLRAYAQLSLHEPDWGFFSLTHRLLVGACMDILSAEDWRRVAGQPPLPPAGGVHDDGRFDRGHASIRTLTFDERCRRVQEALLLLDPEVRAVLVLRHLAGLSYDETAQTLEIATDAVRSRLHAARQKLGEWLLEWPTQSSLDPGDETLLQSGIDGALDYWQREARARLVEEDPDAARRAIALSELGQLLNSLGPTEPPPDLVPEVLSQIAARATTH